MNTTVHPVTTSYSIPEQSPDTGITGIFSISLNTLLEYSGACLGIIGWLGVRQIGSHEAQLIGFLLWVIGGLILVAWGYHTKARGIMAINTVNTVMAASALMTLV
jgi:hypothetical protein